MSERSPTRRRAGAWEVLRAGHRRHSYDLSERPDLTRCTMLTTNATRASTAAGQTKGSENPPERPTSTRSKTTPIDVPECRSDRQVPALDR